MWSKSRLTVAVKIDIAQIILAVTALLATLHP